MSSPPLLKAIFHVHTHWSHDAALSATDLIERCVDVGVDVLAVTDHNEIEGAREVAARAPFQVIVGEELRTAEGGEIIGLFLQTRIPRGTALRDAIRDIHAQGGLVYLPHPFDTLRKKGFAPELLEAIAPDVDIVETFNARNRDPRADSAAKAYAARHGKMSCAGADAHIGPEIGRTVVMLPPFSTPGELLAALRMAQSQEIRNPLWVHWASAWVRLKAHPSRDVA